MVMLCYIWFCDDMASNISWQAKRWVWGWTPVFWSKLIKTQSDRTTPPAELSQCLPKGWIQSDNQTHRSTIIGNKSTTLANQPMKCRLIAYTPLNYAVYGIDGIESAWARFLQFSTYPYQYQVFHYVLRCNELCRFRHVITFDPVLRLAVSEDVESRITVRSGCIRWWRSSPEFPVGPSFVT
jgi:hypothetical protein